MSWYVNFHARSKTVALSRIEEERAKNGQFPEGAAEACRKLIGILPDLTAKTILVDSSGHTDSVGGNAMITVRLVELVE